MRIGILTSSRADFGIYLPLLKKMREDSYFSMEIIAFGTHLSHFFGHSIDTVLEEGFDVPHRIDALVLGDTEESVSTSMALTAMKFSSFWSANRNRFDLIFCLGDRYEMFSAVTAAIPFGIKIAHFHGGETTLGAIDNIFRHSISLASKLHFVSTEDYEKRLFLLTGSQKNIYNVGALSLDSIGSIPLYSIEEFNDKWNIDLSKPSILLTLHPETLAVSKNYDYAVIMARVINSLKDFQFVITMPNADTEGSVIRKVWDKEFTNHSRVFMIENFGTKGYFTCLKYCAVVVGNSSSGIIEAASFNRYVVNVGERQAGRAKSENTYDTPFDEDGIVQLIIKLSKSKEYRGKNLYWNGGASERIIQALKNPTND